MKKTVDEIAAVENTIRQLKDAIWEKDAPNKVQIDKYDTLDDLSETRGNLLKTKRNSKQTKSFYIILLVAKLLSNSKCPSV